MTPLRLGDVVRGQSGAHYLMAQKCDGAQIVVRLGPSRPDLAPLLEEIGTGDVSNWQTWSHCIIVFNLLDILEKYK